MHYLVDSSLAIYYIACISGVDEEMVSFLGGLVCDISPHYSYVLKIFPKLA